MQMCLDVFEEDVFEENVYPRYRDLQWLDTYHAAVALAVDCIIARAM